MLGASIVRRYVWSMDETSARRDPVEERDLGGEPVCLMHRLCPACGGVAAEDPPTRCPRCGAVVDGLQA